MDTVHKKLYEPGVFRSCPCPLWERVVALLVRPPPRGARKLPGRARRPASPGLQWRFVASSTHYVVRGRAFSRTSRASRGMIDGPAAEQNLLAPYQDGDRDRRSQDPIRAHARRSAALQLPVDLLRRAGQPAPAPTATSDTLREFLLRGGTGADGRLPRSVRVGSIFDRRDEEAVSRPRDRRRPEGSSGLQLFLQARRLSADRRPRLVPGRAARWEQGGVRRRTCARFSTTPVAR